MSERDDRPADESSREGVHEQAARAAMNAGSAGSVGAQDGAAGAGSLGAVSSEKPDSVMPQAARDPTTTGPD
jgi:hypothetical protein